MRSGGEPPSGATRPKRPIRNTESSCVGCLLMGGFGLSSAAGRASNPTISHHSSGIHAVLGGAFTPICITRGPGVENPVNPRQSPAGVTRGVTRGHARCPSAGARSRRPIFASQGPRHRPEKDKKRAVCVGLSRSRRTPRVLLGHVPAPALRSFSCPEMLQSAKAERLERQEAAKRQTSEAQRALKQAQRAEREFVCASAGAGPGARGRPRRGVARIGTGDGLGVRGP